MIKAIILNYFKDINEKYNNPNMLEDLEKFLDKLIESRKVIWKLTEIKDDPYCYDKDLDGILKSSEEIISRYDPDFDHVGVGVCVKWGWIFDVVKMLKIQAKKIRDLELERELIIRNNEELEKQRAEFAIRLSELERKESDHQ